MSFAPWQRVVSLRSLAERCDYLVLRYRVTALCDRCRVAQLQLTGCLSKCRVIRFQLRLIIGGKDADFDLGFPLQTRRAFPTCPPRPRNQARPATTELRQITPLP